MADKHLQEEVEELKRFTASLKAQLLIESGLRMASEAMFLRKLPRWSQSGYRVTPQWF